MANKNNSTPIVTAVAVSALKTVETSLTAHAVSMPFYLKIEAEAMEFHCPECGLPIVVANLALAQGIAVCRFCEELHPLPACQKAIPFEHRNHIIPQHDLPKGVQLEEMKDGFRLILSSRNWCNFFGIASFTIVWSGVLLGVIYGTQIASGEFNIMQTLFGLPVLGVTVLLVHLSIMSVVGQCVIEVAGGKFSIRAPGVYKTQSTAWDNVLSCHVTKSMDRDFMNQDSTSPDPFAYKVEIAVERGEPLQLENFTSERKAQLWLCRFLAGQIQSRIQVGNMISLLEGP